MGPKELRQYAALDDAGEMLLGTAVRQMGLSARAYHRVLKLARTIADLAAEESVSAPFVAEALQYRPRVADSWPEVRSSHLRAHHHWPRE
ncbi:MAG TPA: hypothetical protein VK356_06050 [Thermomicrobiales bacterium]|nr:hypothetical protein [Thermomicrobiales bacterium]